MGKNYTVESPIIDFASNGAVRMDQRSLQIVPGVALGALLVLRLV